jgi:hypothetical protein
VIDRTVSLLESEAVFTPAGRFDATASTMSIARA